MSGALIEDGRSTRVIPSLVNACQRVLAVNIDSISGFGNDIPLRLIRPILQGCNADTLLRLEQETPYLREHTSELWKDICVRSYPIVVEKILNSSREEPGSWRGEFFSIREREAKRLEEASRRLRNQRIEAKELKHKRQVKFTAQLPPPKRSRSGCPAAPKTLFQKTRKEATKIQKNVFGSRILPPDPGKAKKFQANADVPRAKITQNDSNSVMMNTIIVRAPCSDSPLLPSQTSRKVESAPKPFELEPLRRPNPSRVVPVRVATPRKFPTATASGQDPKSTYFSPE